MRGGSMGVFVSHNVAGGTESTFSAEYSALTGRSTEDLTTEYLTTEMSRSFLSLLYKSQVTHGRL